MKRINKVCLLSGLLVVLLGFLPAIAQVDYTTGTLRGSVTDPQGAVIVGATVIATNASTGVSKSASSLTDGHYQIPGLPPGVYQISVEAKGFAKEVAKGVEINVGQSQVYDAHMKVGTAGETVEVSADSVPVIQTDQTQQANTINQLQVTELPNISRNITEAVYTLPGVANADAPRSQQPGFTGFFTTGFSIGGSNGRNNLSTIDGGENEYGTGQYRVTTIPLDVIQEFQVNRSGYAAEFGFTDGSAINIVTKSGGNLIHGDVFGHIQNHNTSATNFFNGIERLPAAFSQNIYTGFMIGGPLKKEKLFWNLAYEYQKLDNPDFTNANILSAPTVVGPNAAQAAYISGLKASGNPFLIGFANGITPGLSPLNNPALNTILTRENGVFNNPFRHHNVILRLDAQPSSANTVNLRFGYLHNDNNGGNPDANGLFTRDFSILGTWTHSFKSNVYNQALIQIVPRNVANAVPNPFQGVNFSLGNLNVGNLGGTSSFGSPSLVPYLAHQKRYQFDDNITWTHGAHTVKFGEQTHLADYHVEDDLWFNNEFDFQDGVIPLFSLAPSSPKGACPPLPPTVQLAPVQCQLALFNLANGFPVAGPPATNLSAPQSFAFGIPVDVRVGTNNPAWAGWGKYFGAFVQDSWKITSRFTLNAGVRFDVDAEPSPIGSNFYASPRLGFAWDPFGDGKTVVRAGGGIFVANVDVLIPSYGALLDGSGKYINEAIVALSPTDPRVAQLWGLGVAKGELPFGRLTPADFAAVGINITPGGSVQYGIASGYKNPYTVQASLGVERQLGKTMALDVGYLMYHGVHLQTPAETGFQQINPGSPFCGLTEFANNPGCVDKTGGPLYVPNPITSTQIEHTTYESNGSSIYHALTTSFTKRYSHGLQFQINYTWSKSIDDVVDFASFQEWFRPSQFNLFRAVSVYDIPHTLVANAVYMTPYKTGTGNFLKTALADIALAPIVTVRSGLPFSVRTPSLFNGLSPADSNFAMPFHSSRDNNRGGGYATTDLRFSKAFFINRDRGVKMEFLATGTNIFNRVNFNRVSDLFDINGFPTNGIVQTANGPLNLITGPYTGFHGVKPTNPSQITQPGFFSSADLPRRLQFGLKLSF